MAYTLQNLFKEKAGRVNANESNQEFLSSFLSAANKCILELNYRAWTSGNVVDATNSDTGLDNRYHPALSAGIDFYLSEGSIWNIDSEVDLGQLWEVKKREAQGIYRDDNTPTGANGGTAS